jgi:large subunit ribosomal protein L4
MATLKLTKPTGRASGSVDVDDALFAVEPNVPVMHQVVTAQLAARRAGTQSTKTRAEVRGGGAKPWRQKGTGRSRQGSIRSPQWRGGGVALGPKPRSYAQRTPRKMIRLALASALSDRMADDKVKVLDDWGIDTPSTKQALEVLSSIKVDGRVLVVLTREDVAAWKSLRNLPDVHVLSTGELNAYDVLVSDWVVFTEASLPATRGSAAAAVTEPDRGARGVESAKGGDGEAGASTEAEGSGASSEAKDGST